MLLTLVLLICGVSCIQAQGTSTSKPDLQKVYQEALTWSKTKLEAMPTAQASADIAKGETKSDSKVCHGGKTKSSQVLPITSGCTKKTQQEMNETLDQELTAEKSNQEAEDKILVFVSFSMPTASLVALSQSAEKHHAVLVMRGLKDDSFKETQTAFAALGKDL
ncbi:MAG: TrbC family F-type conjugative pilus assembly protein, partial [Legionellaceae bacterium]